MIERAVDLLRIGAVDHLYKPSNVDDLLCKIRRYQRPVKLPSSLDELNRDTSPSIVKLHSMRPMYAKSADTVLITGET
jgi:DNA-binding NtrC family response regulator